MYFISLTPQLIGTSTTVRHSQRVTYPSVTVCQARYSQPIFNWKDPLNVTSLPNLTDVITAMEYYDDTR